MASDIAGLCASLQNIFVELSQRTTSRDEVARQQLYREGRGLLDDLEKRCASGAGCTPTAAGAKPRTLQDWFERQGDCQPKVKEEDDDDESTVVFSRDDDTSHGSSPDEVGPNTYLLYQVPHS
ncbi:Hypothetical predicted protein [Olea europaea subsp. europaea]|uniref:Uncharacterized protein n=1 Tax=Olea europaea subsp. europaea TaxID=158383 RepID=A0A8S0VP21_OLEEU|nr:Hypothetical predicted protein [Olea europaea subsp. europaea]